jgi:hypothetical protein
MEPIQILRRKVENSLRFDICIVDTRGLICDHVIRAIGNETYEALLLGSMCLLFAPPLNCILNRFQRFLVILTQTLADLVDTCDADCSGDKPYCHC